MADNLEDPSTTATAKGGGELLIDLAGDSDGQNFPEDEDNINVNSGVVLNANFTLTLQTIEDHAVFKVALAMLNKYKYLNLEEKKKMVGFIKKSIGKGEYLPVNCDIHGMSNIGIRCLPMCSCSLIASDQRRMPCHALISYNLYIILFYFQFKLYNMYTRLLFLSDKTESLTEIERHVLLQC
jgi:hypothetical protein